MTTITKPTNSIIDSDVKYDEYTDGFVVETFQAIPQTFTDSLKQERFENSQNRTPDGYHRAASIPVVVIDKWMREGFNFYDESGPAIITRLKQENLDGFITSDKAF